ncbi:hypothetical protein BTS2_3908 [Bacillus sp. TS-2]|nr:hypothetical protein BTS2_3908 [Bacillus sp. TS-2]
MTILYFNLAFVYASSLLARIVGRPNDLKPSLISPNIFFVGIAIACLALISGLRNNIGDTYYYMHSYREFDFTWDNIGSSGDFGFNMLQMLLQQWTKDPQLLLITTAVLTNLFIGVTLYKYSRLIELSLYAYITMGYFLVSMNGVRQYLAAAIIFAATTYLLKGDWKKYMLVVLIASTIHQTALILIPIYFIVRRSAWSKMTLLMLTFTILIVWGFNGFMELLFSLIEGTKYAGYRDFQEGGASLIRVIVAAIPLGLAFLGREKLKELFPQSDIIVNMALLGVIFMMISTQNWIFARFSIYFGLYQLILLPWIVKLFIKKDQKLIYYAIIVCYFLYFFYEHVLSLNINYRSDYIHLSL